MLVVAAYTAAIEGSISCCCTHRNRFFSEVSKPQLTEPRLRYNVVMDDEQQAALSRAVQKVLDDRNLSINAAATRTDIDRNTLSRWQAGLPMGLHLVERWAEKLGLDANEWRLLAGYKALVTGYEVLHRGVAAREAAWDSKLPMSFHHGTAHLTVQDAEGILRDLDRQHESGAL